MGHMADEIPKPELVAPIKELFDKSMVVLENPIVPMPANITGVLTEIAPIYVQ